LRSSAAEAFLDEVIGSLMMNKWSSMRRCWMRRKRSVWLENAYYYPTALLIISASLYYSHLNKNRHPYYSTHKIRFFDRPLQKSFFLSSYTKFIDVSHLKEVV
jgi:hypothetical protein